MIGLMVLLDRWIVSWLALALVGLMVPIMIGALGVFAKNQPGAARLMLERTIASRDAENEWAQSLKEEHA